jgi:diguanylate cyclase (GGDEF)-like protein/PAS domain S-box-containing protein
MSDTEKTKEDLLKELDELRLQLEIEEKRFRSITENAREWIWEVDEKGKYTYASPVVEKILGYSPNEILGKYFFDLFHPEDREPLKKAAFDVFKKKESFRDFINRNIHRTGSIVWLSTSGTPILDRKGNLIGYRGADFDITKRMEAEEFIRESENKYKILVEQSVQGIVIGQGTPPKIAFVNSAMSEILGYSLDELYNLSPKEVKKLVHPEDQTLFFTRYQDRLEGKDAPDHYEVRAVRKDGAVRWVEIYSSLIEYKGKPAVQAVFLDITDRKKTEEAFRKSEEQYRTLQSNIPVAVFRTSAASTGGIISSNPALAKMFGYKDPDSMADIHVSELYLNKEERQKFLETLVSEGEISDYEVQFKRKDGKIFWGSLSAKAVANEGGNIEFIDGILEDITVRKKAEEALQKSEEQYRSLHSNIPVGVFRTTADPSGHIVSSNPALAKMFGYKNQEEMAEIKVADLYLNQEDRKRFIDMFDSSGEISDYEVQFKRKDGKIFWGSLTARAVRDKAKKIEFLDGILEDITERKAAEEALQESEEKYRSVVDNSLVGFYITQKNLIKFCNQRLAEMFGYTNPEELAGKHIKELTAPESWELVDKQVKLRESGEQESVHYEFKGMKRNGYIFDLEALGARIIYEGSPAIQGNMIDITERRKAEEELRKFATTDVLTGVLNRGYALLLFGKQLQLSKRNKSHLSICYIDVDGLKDINDTYGHHEGDEALKLISRFLKETLRESDIACRLGGDEFLLIFPQCTIGQTIFIWERIARKVNSFNLQKIKPYSISLSRGFAEYDPYENKSVDQLIALADHEMYRDKHAKKL